jgi:hypothetical protein
MVTIRKKQTTVREELESWNVVYVMKRLNQWYGKHLNTWNTKKLQGLEASDFSMNVISKIISGERSWENSGSTDFMSFVYNVARSEFSTWKEGLGQKSMISIDLLQENKSNLHIRDDYEGF